jgi:hypothetical protein
MEAICPPKRLKFLPDYTVLHPEIWQSSESLPWKLQMSLNSLQFQYSTHDLQRYVFQFTNRGGRGVSTSDSDTVITEVKDILSMNCHIPYSRRVTTKFLHFSIQQGVSLSCQMYDGPQLVIQAQTSRTSFSCCSSQISRTS